MILYDEDIYTVIPNRYPLMILNSLEIIDDKATSIIKLTEDDWFFKCHYPGDPVLPLSILLESMTQTFSATFVAGREEKPVISSISEIRLKERCIPGDELRLEAQLESFRRGIAKGNCSAYKNDGENPIMEIKIVEVLPSQLVKCNE